MIFTDLRFVALFAACWICFFVAPRRWRATVLAVLGLVFYAMYAGAFALVVLGLTATALYADRRLVAWIAGAATIGMLTAFKLGSNSDVLPTAPAGSTSAVLVPIGFSYLAFELLHVVIERRRGRIRELAAPDLLAFAFFFPTRVAGPIKRYPDFLAAVARAEPSAENVYRGLLRILMGLSKKLLVADLLALTVAERSYAATPAHAWVITLAYAVQIYFDFSAYSDIAIGFSRMLGIAVPENFAWPYLAPNIREFWNRWHMTLSFWVRDYIFLPTGRALFKTSIRSWPAAIAVVSYLLTFAIVGAWHGLTAAFVVWGLYHGALLSAHHVIRLKTPAWIADHPLYHSRISRAASAAFTFACVAVGWVPFMTDLPSSGRLLKLMFGARH